MSLSSISIRFAGNSDANPERDGSLYNRRDAAHFSQSLIFSPRHTRCINMPLNSRLILSLPSSECLYSGPCRACLACQMLVFQWSGPRSGASRELASIIKLPQICKRSERLWSDLCTVNSRSQGLESWGIAFCSIGCRKCLAFFPRGEIVIISSQDLL